MSDESPRRTEGPELVEMALYFGGLGIVFLGGPVAAVAVYAHSGPFFLDQGPEYGWFIVVITMMAAFSLVAGVGVLLMERSRQIQYRRRGRDSL